MAALWSFVPGWDAKDHRGATSRYTGSRNASGQPRAWQDYYSNSLVNTLAAASATSSSASAVSSSTSFTVVTTRVVVLQRRARRSASLITSSLLRLGVSMISAF